MIIAKLTDSQRYEPLHPLFKTAFDYIKQHDLLNAELGRIELQGDELFINNVEATLVEKSAQPLEVHRQYIDIHVPLDGTEIVGWKALCDTATSREAFDVENDFALYDEPATTYTELHTGEFLIVYPEDAHAPIIGNGKLRKLIVKVRL